MSEVKFIDARAPLPEIGTVPLTESEDRWTIYFPKGGVRYVRGPGSPMESVEVMPVAELARLRSELAQLRIENAALGAERPSLPDLG